MISTLITSCGRIDLLSRTVESLLTKQEQRLFLNINEDSPNADLYQPPNAVNFILNKTGGIGQHASIEQYLKTSLHKYYLHCEDDFHFDNDYDWIKASMDIMEADPQIIKVLARKDSQHPCIHDRELNGIKYGLLQPDWHHVGITWQGFSWNPGLTRMDLLKQFMPFRRWEQDVAEDIAWAGYKVVELEQKVYHHIGEGRSTHE